ncbi:deoxycytidylate deaminase-like isoform X2 [Anguilla anguilla]|uniref:deoxycytidylate deaminase-like isoform X2 n=1 Tax=Anguilla anguilla TaxID=7936 RepID=UPI0015AB2A52|nr:deoxycytidylate deaminase-like isoform X2 [Anguilla anguilla]
MTKTTKQQSRAGGSAEGPSGGGTGSRLGFLGDSVYFMAVALLTSKRSRDPNTQVGACIVNQENKVVGVGHNDMPNGCDGQLSWGRFPKDGTGTDTQWVKSKDPYVCHAELNAIMNKNCADLNGCSMYVTLFPCNDCARLIAQAGIKEVVYLSDKYGDRKETLASKRLFDKARVVYKPFEGAGNPITLNFS